VTHRRPILLPLAAWLALAVALGAATLAAEAVGGPEAARLQRAARRYRAQLLSHCDPA
jgi:hypothetical protein